MRLMRRFGGSLALTIGLTGWAALSMGALLAATAGSAAAASAVATVTPSNARPGAQVIFAVSCASSGASSATLLGTTLGLPARIPMNNGLHAGTFAITVTLPNTIRPGTFTPDIDCSDGSTAIATLHVTTMPARGGVETGDGTTATQTNMGLAAGGLAMIGIGVMAGGIALRRRSSASRR